MAKREITLPGMREAQNSIAMHIRRTPLVDSSGLSYEADRRVAFKLENLQATGSFKVRGAANKVISLSDEERRAGVVTVSSGNHGRAVAYVANRLEVPAVVCISGAVPENKRVAIERLGAEVVVGGATYDETALFADELMSERGLTMVHPFDDSHVIEGQGTIGLELLEDRPEIDTVLVPLSGGGLLSGIAFALKETDPSIRTIGITMERGPAMIESVRADRIVEVKEVPSLADALAGGLGPSNQYTFGMIKQLVDETVTVTEREMAMAMIYAFEEHRLVVEGGGAVGIAALLAESTIQIGRNVAVVISGGNVDLSLLQRVASGELPFGE